MICTIQLQNEQLPMEEVEEKTSNWLESNFSYLYKCSGRTTLTSQEERREMFLLSQKEKRQEALNEKRNIQELFSRISKSMEREKEVRENGDRDQIPFAYKQMRAEYLTEIPTDLSQDWVIKLCPEGVRYLVVAYNGWTTCYLRNGKERFKFKSNLPGGNMRNLRHKFTVLDCVYNPKTQTFFVYDVLAWNSLCLPDTEAEFRFFWLKSKFDENPEFATSTCPNFYNFVAMDPLPAEVSLMQDYMSSPYLIKDKPLSLEGILFYHKKGHYEFGRTPLVCWIKSHMLTKKFNIDVHSSHLENHQSDISDPQIQEIEM